MIDRAIHIDLFITDDEDGFPEEVAGACGMCGDDRFKVMVNGTKSKEEQAAAFLHECLHIWHCDHVSGLSADRIEAMRRAELKKLLKIMKD